MTMGGRVERPRRVGETGGRAGDCWPAPSSWGSDWEPDDQVMLSLLTNLLTNALRPSTPHCPHHLAAANWENVFSQVSGDPY